MLASLWFHGEPQGCVKTVHLHSLAYEVTTALKFCRNIIKHSRSCRPRALGSMISVEAATEDGRSKLRTFFLKIHKVKSYQIYIRVWASSALSSAPWRIAEKIVVRWSGPLQLFSNMCPMLENGQVESFRRAMKSLRGRMSHLSLVQFRLVTTQ